MPKNYFLVLLCSVFSFAAYAQTNIIPRPTQVMMTKMPGFPLSAGTTVDTGNMRAQKSIDFLQDYLQDIFGFKLTPGTSKGIKFRIDEKIKGNEGSYKLMVSPAGITISAAGEPGFFYGVQTLIQLLPASKDAKILIPSVNIQDSPRFSYRGMHLDVSRHFFDLDFVKKYIDYLAMHKMNYFHWHLTDDQGWRIEIKKYPNLTQAGAYRNGTIIGHHPGTGNDNTRYGGFYTQDEVKEIVQYAADRYITVIPEIELPGHASAAIAAYNWLSCFPDEDTDLGKHPSAVSQQTKGKKVQETWGVFNDVFCAGKDSTFGFLQDVMDEVLPLFPAKYVHVGGDECPKENWKRCASCQKRIKDENLKDEHGLQSYVIQRMEKYLNEKGKTIIGWDEILEGGLAPNAIVMSWRGEEGGIEAAKQNHQVIMTPGSHVYFDYAQTKPEDSLTIGGFIPVDKVYSYEPVPAKLPAANHQYVLGAQANLWTEYIGNPAKVEYQIFPRMTALSEVLWSGKDKRNWDDFRKRLKTQYMRYDLWGANYNKVFRP